MPKRQREREQRGRRPVGTRLKAELVLFAVEGKTEKEYLTALQRERYDRRLVFKQIGSQSKTSLRNLVDAARRGEKDSFGGHICIVCDVDENSVHRELLQSWLDETERHHLALTNPSIEYWILQHICDAGEPQTAGEAELNLRKRISGYKKGMTFPSNILNGVDDACRRERVRGRSRDEPELWENVVGTTWHNMIEFLDDLAKDHELREMELRSR